LFLSLAKFTEELLICSFLYTQRKCVFVTFQRDRDLELAARIGQALLKRNHVLSEQNEALEEQLGQAFDQVSLCICNGNNNNWALFTGEVYFHGYF
jgi:hypothetical protein